MGRALQFVKLVAVIALTAIVNGVSAQTVVGFYDNQCPNAESIIQGMVQTRFNQDNSIAAALLRLFFHDCFAGCDASILIDSTPSNEAEMSAVPNQGLRGFDLIDEIKAAVENACPGVVSCADILALATMGATSLAGGPQWTVPTGRRDSTVSLAATANSLPSQTMTVAQASQSFASIGLSPQDLVILLGAHTVGATHCNFMADRLYNFQNTGAPDPTMDPGLVQGLKNVCVPPGVNGPDTGIFLDQGTGTIFDNVYFQQLLLNRGVMQIDQELSNDPTTSPFVQSYAGAGSFFADFATSMVKLGNNNVLTGSQGEIRLTCSAING